MKSNYRIITIDTWKKISKKVIIVYYKALIIASSDKGDQGKQ
jgi:hypothetical protein